MAGRPTLIIFARAPRLGTVKRRLARGVGAMAALRFHRGQLFGLARGVGRDRRWRTELVVTPDATARRGARWPAGIARRTQRRTAFSSNSSSSDWPSFAIFTPVNSRKAPNR